MIKRIVARMNAIDTLNEIEYVVDAGILEDMILEVRKSKEDITTEEYSEFMYKLAITSINNALCLQDKSKKVECVELDKVKELEEELINEGNVVPEDEEEILSEGNIFA